MRHHLAALGEPLSPRAEVDRASRYDVLKPSGRVSHGRAQHLPERNPDLGSELEPTGHRLDEPCRSVSRCISRAHASARWAAVDRFERAGKTTVSASPPNLPTVPPYESTSSIIVSKYLFRIVVSSSVPCCPTRPSASLIGVKPEMSANNAAAWKRCSRPTGLAFGSCSRSSMTWRGTNGSSEVLADPAGEVAGHRWSDGVLERITLAGRRRRNEKAHRSTRHRAGYPCGSSRQRDRRLGGAFRYRVLQYDEPGHVCTNGIEFGVAYPFGQAANLAVRGDRGHLDANNLFVADEEIVPQTTIGPLTQFDPNLMIGGNPSHWFDFYRFAWTVPVAVGSPIQLHISGPSNVFPSDTIEDCALPLWPFTGFAQPVDNSPTVNRMNAGRTVPVKFSLGGDRGLDIFQSGYPQVRSVSCPSGSADVVEETFTAEPSRLTYSSGNGQYTSPLENG